MTKYPDKRFIHLLYYEILVKHRERSEDRFNIWEKGMRWESVYTLARPNVLISAWPDIWRVLRYFAVEVLFKGSFLAISSMVIPLGFSDNIVRILAISSA